MNSGPTLSNGSSGSPVRRLQRLLVMLKLLDDTQINGQFASTTEQATRDFQLSAGLLVDGIAGPQTWHALPADPNTPLRAEGSSGPVVKALQQGLKKYSPAPGSPSDTGPVDGIFGPKTDYAVRAYQADRGVRVDGAVGDQTWWVPAGGAGATLASLAGLTTV